jgi:hypothetical protein
MLRLILLPAFPNLWEDEIIAVTHAVQPLDRLLVNVVRNDIHPPVYFLQLHLWGTISRADIWFELNSVVWSFLALFSLWTVTRRLTNDSHWALVAVGVLAVMPQAVDKAYEVRMYAMLSTLVIWAYYFAHRTFVEDSGRSRWFLAGLSLLLVYTHAIGFLAVLFNGVYALTQLIRRRVLVRTYFSWLAIFGGVGILASPILTNDMLHDAGLPAIGGVSGWLASAVLGDGPGYSRAQYFIGLGLCLIVIAAGLADSRTRSLTLSFVILPLFLAVGLGLAVKPIYKTNFFSTIMSPFIALILARLILDLSRPVLRLGMFLALAITLGSMAATVRSLIPKSTDYPAAAAAIRARALPGDVIYAPQVSMFWGMAWNLAGPDWGSPLDIAPPPSPQWQGVYRRLGPALVSWLGLMPTTQSLRVGDVTLLVGNGSLPLAERAPRLCLVTYLRDDLPEGMPSETIGALHKVSNEHFGARMELTFYAR